MSMSAFVSLNFHARGSKIEGTCLKFLLVLPLLRCLRVRIKWSYSNHKQNLSEVQELHHGRELLRLQILCQLDLRAPSKHVDI